MRNAKLAFFLAIVFIVLLSAATSDNTPQKEVRYIDVTGSSETFIEPDRVYFNIELREFLKGKEKITLDTLEKQLHNALKAGGIAMENLSVTKFNAALYNKNKRNSEFLGTKSLKLKLTDIKQLDPFFVALDDSDVKFVYYDHSDHSELQKFRLENKVNAVKAAQTKAKAMVEIIGSKLGAPIYIIEVPEEAYTTKNKYVSNSNVRYDNYSGKMKEYDENSGALGQLDNVSFEKIKLLNAVEVRFEIVAN